MGEGGGSHDGVADRLGQCDRQRSAAAAGEVHLDHAGVDRRYERERRNCGHGNYSKHVHNFPYWAASCQINELTTREPVSRDFPYGLVRPRRRCAIWHCTSAPPARCAYPVFEYFAVSRAETVPSLRGGWI